MKDFSPDAEVPGFPYRVDVEIYMTDPLREWIIKNINEDDYTRRYYSVAPWRDRFYLKNSEDFLMCKLRFGL